MVALDVSQAATASHAGPTVTEWIPAFAAAVVSPMVTLYVMHRQNANALRIAWQQNDAALTAAREQNANALALAQQQNETALRVARQRVLADVVSASRRQWLDTLRDTIAKCLAVAGRFGGVRAVSSVNVETPSEHIATIERLTFLYMKLSLLLNLAKEDHARLAAAAGEVLQAAAASPPDTSAIGKAYYKVADAARPVLKREWERIKAEPTDW